MSRGIYYSFHYQDVIDLRANVVPNHWVARVRGVAGFFDASIWSNAKIRGDAAIRHLIDTALLGTSVTCVLVGSYTYNRQWVRYEILKSVLFFRSMRSCRCISTRCRIFCKRGSRFG